MSRAVLAIPIVFVVFFLVPLPFYAGLAALVDLEPPEGDFMLGVVVEKLGHAAIFVLLFHAARGAFHDRWLIYASLWWVLFALGEAGVALRGEYTWSEAGAGILAEAVYLPLGAFIVNRMLRAPRAPSGSSPP